MTDAASTDGVPTVSTRRAQTAIDVGAALVITMLVWPFPIARAMLPPLVNVACILVAWQLIQVAYFAACSALWSTTGGMRLMGLTLAEPTGARPSRAVAVRWGLLAGVLGIPRLFATARSAGKPDAAERFSGARVVRVAPPSDADRDE